jgi:hypothetical protein
MPHSHYDDSSYPPIRRPDPPPLKSADRADVDRGGVPEAVSEAALRWLGQWLRMRWCT